MSLWPQGLGPPPALDAAQLGAWQRDAAFIGQLQDSRQMAPYLLPMELAAELRAYQRDGISWLAFLRRSGLHGVLADDMGELKRKYKCRGFR